MPYERTQLHTIPAGMTGRNAAELIGELRGPYRARTLETVYLYPARTYGPRRGRSRIHPVQYVFCSRHCAAAQMRQWAMVSTDMAIYSGVYSGRCGDACAYCGAYIECSDRGHIHVRPCDYCGDLECDGDCRTECEDCGYRYDPDDYCSCPSCGCDGSSGPPAGCPLCSDRPHGAPLGACQGSDDPRYSGDISAVLAVIASA